MMLEDGDGESRPRGSQTWSFTDAGQGPTLLLLHGLGSRKEAFGELSSLLTAHYRVIALDLPGYSRNFLALDEPVPGFDELAFRIADFIAQFKLQPLAILGHSFGGAVALRAAALEYPTINNVLLISPGGFGPELNPLVPVVGSRFGSGIISLLASPRGLRLISRSSKFASRTQGRSGDQFKELTGLFASLGDRAARQKFATGIKLATKANRNRDVSSADALPSEVRVLVLWGSEDQILPEWQASRVRRLIPHAKVLLLEGSGHNPHSTAPNIVATSIVEFLAEADKL